MSPRATLTALQYAVKLLASRPYSEFMLRKKLIDRKYEREDIATAIETLKQKNFLDDRKFAENFVRARLTAKPRVGFLLERDLMSKGIKANIAHEIVTQLCPKENEIELARALLTRKSSQYKNLDDNARYRRISGFLARRGFSSDTIRKVMKEPSESFES